MNTPAMIVRVELCAIRCAVDSFPGVFAERGTQFLQTILRHLQARFPGFVVGNDHEPRVQHDPRQLRRWRWFWPGDVAVSGYGQRQQ